MSARRPWQIWLAILGIFMSGAVAGGFLAPRLTNRAVERGRTPREFVPHMMDRLTRGLDLSEEQVGRIRPIVDQAWEQLNALRRDSAEVMRLMYVEIEGELTPEQLQRHEEYQNERRLRWQRMIEEREKRAREGEAGGS